LRNKRSGHAEQRRKREEFRELKSHRFP